MERTILSISSLFARSKQRTRDRKCIKKVPIWSVLLLLFVACTSFYLYLYTNAFYGMKTSSVFRIVERKQQVVREDIILDDTAPLLTLFTSWNDNPEKYLVHNLTVQNWMMLRPFVISVVFTNETAVAEECARKGFQVRHISVAAADGIPVLKYMFRDVIENYNSTFYAYSNGDILYTDTLKATLLKLKNSSIYLGKPKMIVGIRTNVDNVTESEASTWDNITELAKKRGKLFDECAEDYFITTRSFPWEDLAEVVIGRRAYDNWLVYYSRKSNHIVIDGTKTILAVHQTTNSGNSEGHGHKNADYNHNLLVKMYKSIKYIAGFTTCIEKYTVYDDGDIVVKSRTVNQTCAV